MLVPEWNERFVATIEAEIVPRLLALTGRAPVRLGAGHDVVSAVADAAVAGEAGLIEQHIAHHVANGGTVSDALVSIIAPAARLLGADWESDTRDFLDVTVGLGTLHQVLVGLTDVASDETLPHRRILLARTPGEDHTLGLAIVDHFFRVARWEVHHEPYGDRASIVAAVASDWYAVAGLSLAGDTFVNEARATICAMRTHSANPDLRVMVGGPAFSREPELATAVGADALARDGQSAVGIANSWIQPAERLR
jgi:methanogenic corrinoid protein MtbC1